MTMLALAIVMLCVCSVSAVEDTNLNSTLETVDDNSQDSIVIDEINENHGDGASLVDSSVSVDDEKQVLEKKEVLKASDENVLGADMGGYLYIWDHDTAGRPSGANYNVPNVADQTIENYVAGDTVTIDFYMRSLNGYTFKLKLGNTDVASYTHYDSYSWVDNAFSYTFNNPGDYTFLVYYQGSENRYVSNTLTYKVANNIPDTTLEIYNPDDVNSNKFVYANQQSVDFTIENILSSKDLTTAQLRELVASSRISYYLNGANVGTTAVGYEGSPASMTLSLSSGKNVIQYEFSGNSNIEGSKSNKITVWVGQEPEEYSTILIFKDGTLTPDANGVYYVPITTSTKSYAELYNYTLGENIKNYVLIENGDVLENATLYYEFSKSHEIQISPNGEWNDGLDTTFMEAEVVERYIVYEGNELGLLPSMSDVHKYFVYVDTTATTVNINPTTYTVGKGSSIKIEPSVTYDTYYYDPTYQHYDSNWNIITGGWRQTKATMTDGQIDIYDGNIYLGTITAGESFDYIIPSSASSGSHTIDAKYRGYNVTEKNTNYVIAAASSGSKSFNVASAENSLSLTVNGETEITVAPGTTLNVVGTLQKYYSSYDYVYWYLNGERLGYGYVSGDGLVDTLTVDEDNLGDNELYLYYQSGYSSQVPNAVSNKVIIHVAYPERDTTTTVSVKPTETDLGNIVSITPTVSYGTTELSDGIVELYINDTKVANLAPGETYSYVPSKYGTYTVNANYLGATIGEYTYKASNGEESFVVKTKETPITGGLAISVTNTTYGNTKATISVSQEGTYTIKINDAQYGEDIVFSEAGSKNNIAITGFAASESEYTATITNVETGQTNTTKFKISQAPSTITVNDVVGNNSLLSGTQSFTVSTQGTGKITINGESQQYDIGEVIVLSSLLDGENIINIHYAGDENYTSCDKQIMFKVFEKYPSSVDFDLNTSYVAKDGKIKVINLDVKVNGESVNAGTVNFYDENDALIGSVDLPANEWEYQTTGAAGTSHSIYAVYLENDELKYAESNSSKKDYSIKKDLKITITLTSDDSIIRSYSNNVELAIQYSEPVTDNLHLMNKDNELWSEDGSSSSSINYNYYSVGENEFYIVFDGNDEYSACESNHVIVKAYQTKSVTLGLDSNVTFAVEGGKVLLTPSATYYNNGYVNAPNVVKLYADSSLTDLIDEINVGDTYEYTIPTSDSTDSSYRKTIYLSYPDYKDDGEYTIYQQNRAASKSITILTPNSAALTADGKQDSLEVRAEDKITLHVDVDKWTYSSSYDYSVGYVYNSDVVIYIKNSQMDSFVEYGTFALESNQIKDAEISFSEPDVYTIYAFYKGKNASSQYDPSYAPAKSNEITITVGPKEIKTNISLSSRSNTPKYGEEITIIPTVTAGDNEITDGTIIYYINDKPISDALAYDEEFKWTVDRVDEFNITAKYSGYDIYLPSENSTKINSQKAENEAKVTVTSQTYPENVTITVESLVSGVYTVDVNGTPVSVKINDGETSASVSHKWGAGSYYANITTVPESDIYVSSTLNGTFTVSPAQNNAVITIAENNYLPGSVNVQVTGVKGKYVVTIDNGQSVEVDVESDGATGSNTILLPAKTGYVATLTLDNKNYTTTAQPVTFNVIKSPNKINITVNENNYLPGDVVVNVEADVGGVYTVTVGDGKSVDVEVDDTTKKGSGTISLPASEGYVATTDFADRENYDVVINPATFNVLKSDIDLKIIIDQIVYGNPVIGTIVTNVSGTYTIKIADKPSFNVNADVGSTPFTSDIYLDVADNYKAQIDIDSQADYNSKHDETTFKVVQSETDFKANSTKEKYSYEEHVILNIYLPEDATGNVIFTYVDGSVAGVINDVTKTKTLDLGVLDAKSYTIQAKYSGDNNYEGLTKTVNFEVVPKDNEITVTVIADKYPNNVTIKVSATIEGDYEIDINGEKYTVTANGEGLTHKFAAKSYYANITYKNSNYNVITHNTTFTVEPASNVIVVSVGSDVIYGDSLTVSVSASVPDTYIVNVAGTDVPVTVVDALKTETVSVDLAVGDNYEAITTWSNENYTVDITNAVFNVVPKVNEVTISIANVEYGNPVVVELSGAAKGSYVVDINGKKVSVEVGEDGCGSKEESLDLGVGNYSATLSFENDNYTTSFTDGEFKVTPKTNKITVEAQDTTLPGEVTVNLTADVAGNYRVYFNNSEYLVFEIKSPNAKESKTIALGEGSYVTSVEFSNENYTNIVENAEFKVMPKPIEVYIKNANGPNEVTIESNYVLEIQYLVEKPDVEIASENIYLYCNDQLLPNQFTSVIHEGEYSPLGTVTITEAGTFVFKLEYNVTASDGTKYSKISENTVKVISNIPESQSEIIKIRDKGSGNSSSVTINSEENVTVTVQYYLDKPSSWLSNELVTIWVNGVINKTFTYPTGSAWTGNLELTFNESAEVSVYATYTADGFSIFNVEDVDERTPTLKYYITIETPVSNNVTIESKEVDYGTNANLTVVGTDGEYTVSVNGKPYDVSVVGGMGYAVIDVLAGNKTYDVNVVSKTDETLFNSSKLTVKPISPNLTIDATNKDYTYGDLTTITVDKNSTATGSIKIFDGETELNSLNDIKFDAGKHIIKAFYAADGNFTNQEVIVEINVARTNNNLTIEVTNETYPNNVTITLNAAVPGDYTVMIGDVSYVVSVGENGIGTKSVNILPGVKTATVEYEQTTNYNANSSKTEFEVYEQIIENIIDVKVTPATYPENATVTVSATVDGNYTVDINGSKVKVEVKDGKGNSTINLPAGNYLANLTADGKTATDEFTISKGKNDIKVIVEDTTLPNQVIVTVTADVDDTYTVVINETEVKVVVTEGSGKENVTLNVGSYVANTTWSNKNYDVTIVNDTFNVYEAQSSSKLTIRDANFTDNATISIKSQENVTIYIEYNVELPNGSLLSSYIEIYANGKYLQTINNPTGGIYTAILPISVNETSTLTVNATYKGWVFMGSEYAENSNTLTYDIVIENKTPEVPQTVSVEVSNPTYPEKTTITVKSNKDDVFNVVIGNQTFDIEVINGSGVKTVQLGAGNYTAIATSKTNDTISNSTDFEIKKAKSQIKLTSNETEIVEGQAIKLSYTLSENATGTVELFDGETLIDDIDNVVLSVGNHTITAKYGGNDNFTESSDSLTILVSEKEISIEVKVTPATYPENATVSVVADVDGEYVVDINGTAVTVNVKDGKGNSTVNLPAGNYLANLTSGNKTVTDEFTISKGQNNIKVSVDDVDYPNDVTITVTADVDDTYTVDVNGTKVDVKVENGKGNATVKLDAGSYNANVLYDNANYESNVTSDDFVVNPFVNNISLSVDSPTSPDNATITVTADVDDTYTVDVNGTKVDVKVENGKGNSTVNLPAGDYVAKLENETVEFTVYPKAKQTPDLNANVENATEGETKLVVETPKDATGNVSAKINGKTYSAPINDGKAVIDLSELSNGKYDAEISYPGDDKYSAGNTTKEIEIAKKEEFITVIASDMKRGYNSPYDYQATFLDNNGKPLQNKEVMFIINGNEYSATTDSNGLALLSTSNLAVGSYEVTSINPVTGENSTNKISILARIIGNKNMVLDYNSNYKYQVSVIGDDGELVGEGVVFEINIKGKLSSFKTDANGKLTIKFNSNYLPGKYTLNLAYKGYSVKNIITVKQILKSKKVVTVKKSAKKLVLKATLKSSKGKAIKNKKITFKFKGKTYKAKTNSKGIAKVTIKKNVIKKLKAGKNYAVKITYLKDTIKTYVKAKK